MGKNILVVEDNKEIIKVLEKRLEVHGFSVSVAEGGYAVLEALRNDDAPDAVILDLMIPERSGMELLCSIKNKWPQTKIFIFSAHEEYKAKMALYKDYICAFFSKTDGIENLIAAIKSQIDE
jgi:two-component system response regulator PrrA